MLNVLWLWVHPPDSSVDYPPPSRYIYLFIIFTVATAAVAEGRGRKRRRRGEAVVLHIVNQVNLSVMVIDHTISLLSLL